MLIVTVEEARQPYIYDALANRLAAIDPELDPTALIGKSLDTLYKEGCGQGTLKTPAGQQAIAPLAFISNLADVLSSYVSRREGRG